MLVSFDFSAVGRQGALVNFGNPIRGLKPIGRMFRSFAFEGAALRVMRELGKRENAKLYARAELQLMDIDGRPSKREEVYLGRWAAFVPGVRASERAFVTYLNLQRADTFDAMAAMASRNGTIDTADAKAIARFVNVFTGRGSLNQLAQAARVLSQALWSPRLALSRFQVLLLQPLWAGRGVSFRTRAVIALEYAKTLTGIAVFFATITAALWALIGPPGPDEEWNIELDPRSSDFMRIRIGDTRIRPLAGLSLTTVLLARLITGKMKTLGGEIIPIRGVEVPFGRRTGSALVGAYLRNKLAPIPGTVSNILSGVSPTGEIVTTKTVARDLTVPLSFREIGTLMKEHGVPAALTMQMLEVGGMGVQNYDDRNVKKPEIPLHKIRNTALRERTRRQRAQARADKLADKFRSEGATSRTAMLRRFREDFIEQHPATKLRSKAYPAAQLRFRRAMRRAGN